MVVCFRLLVKGAALAVVAHTTARNTERKKALENFIAERRVLTEGVRGERRGLVRGESPCFLRLLLDPFVLARYGGPGRKAIVVAWC